MKSPNEINKHVRMSLEENRMLTEKARSAGMSDSSYLRMMIRQNPTDYPEIQKLLKELINEINHIGVNINQIVKNHNEAFYTSNDKTRLFAYMRKLNESVNEVVRSLGSQ